MGIVAVVELPQHNFIGRTFVEPTGVRYIQGEQSPATTTQRAEQNRAPGLRRVMGGTDIGISDSRCSIDIEYSVLVIGIGELVVSGADGVAVKHSGHVG